MENGKFVRKTTQDNFITEKVDIFKNNLLGQYDDSGNYEIAPQIIKELLELKKVRKSSYENSMFCTGNLLGFGEISFEIYYDKSRDKNNNATAYLYVLEDVDKINGYLQNILKTKIAEFSSTDSDFIEETYAKFNVTDETQDDDEGREKKTLDDLELEDSYILAKKAYMLLLGKLSEEKVLDAYGKYFTARLTTLTKLDNEFSNAVLQNFNQKYELIENIFLKEKNYKALNELLDACIEGVSGTKEIYIDQEKNFSDLMKEHLDVFTESINKLNDKAEQKAIDMLDPDDRKKLNQMNDSLGSSDENKLGEETSQEEKNTSTIESEISESFQNPVLFDAEERQKESDENPENSEDGKDGSNIVEQILKMQTDSHNDDEISKEYVDSNADFQKMRKSDRLSTINDRLSRLSNATGSEEDVEREQESSEDTEIEEINNSREETFESSQPLEDNQIIENEMPMESDDSELEESKDQNPLNKQRFSALFDYLEKKQDEEKVENKQSKSIDIDATQDEKDEFSR